MNKLVLICAAALLLFSCNSAPKGPEDAVSVIAANSFLMLNHLKGMVMIIEETRFTPDSLGQIGEMDSCCLELTILDKAGFWIKYEDKDQLGNIVEEMIFENLEDGKFKSATKMINGVEVMNMLISRSEDGKALYAVDTDSSGAILNYYNEISENDLGQVLGGTTYTGDSVILGAWSRNYIDGLQAGRGWVDSSGVQSYKSVGALNEQGLLATMSIERLVGDSTVKTVETYVYDSFDETGNWSQKTTLDEDGKATKVVKRMYTYFE
jgi:hypothetical protein